MSSRDRMTDSEHLRTSQYRNDAQLQKRIAIHRRFSTNPQSWHAWVCDQVGFPATPKVLDVGCGTGAFWNENRHRLPDGLELTLTDLSAGMLDSATSLLGDLVAASRVADVQALPFPDASFDLVIANHMLYHVPDIGQAISEIGRVLTGDGVLIATTNGERHMVETHDLIAEVQQRRPNRGIATRFSLENGAAQLATTFARVERRDFANDLAVMEVGPVIDYLESTSVEDGMTEAQLDLARDIVATAIDRDGVFRIRTSAGVFIGRK